MKTKTVSLPGFDPLLILCKLDKTQRLPSLVRAGNWTVLAWNPVSTVTTWEALQTAIDRRRSAPSVLPFTGGFIGYIGYDTTYDLLKIRATAKDDLQLPAMCFHEYDNAVLFDHSASSSWQGGKRVHIVGDTTFVREVIETHERSLMPVDVSALDLKPGITKAAYRAAFNRIQTAILDGDIYQINYAYRFSGVCAGDRRRLFASLFHRNAAARASYIETDDCALLSLSPEQFVSIRGDRIVTSPIKGTRPRAVGMKEDQRLRRELLASHKEQAELNMITDLLRNDLGQICRAGSVKVREHRAVQANPSVWHTYSVIEGRLEPGCSVTHVFRSMLPGGSITGCPKKRATAYIDQLEPLRRGPYTGTLAMFSDNGRVESSILIRTLIAKQHQIYLHVGGGIVADSDWQSEWDETLAKAKTFLDQPSLKHSARAETSGPAVFETLRTYHGKMFALDEHLSRLRSSAKLLGFTVPQTDVVIVSRLTKLVGKPRHPVRIKIIATSKDVTLHAERLVIDPADLQPISTKLFPLERVQPQAKAMPYDDCIAAHAWARSQRSGEALLVDAKGRVTEGAYSNLFWVERGTLWTPGASMLEGITRAHVIALAAALKIPVRFALPSVNRLLAADEVFITRTTVGIVPVCRINDQMFRVGPLTKKLMQRWNRDIGRVLT